MKQQMQSLYEYLEPYLESGDPQAIQDARKRFYRLYKAQWRRQRRQEQKEYTVSFTRSELAQIRSAAKQYHRSITAFIKAAALTTGRSTLLIPDEAAYKQIQALLTKNYTLLERIEEQRDDGAVPKSLLPQFEVLEQQILTALKPQQSDH